MHALARWVCVKQVVCGICAALCPPPLPCCPFCWRVRVEAAQQARRALDIAFCVVHRVCYVTQQHPLFLPALFAGLFRLRLPSRPGRLQPLPFVWYVTHQHPPC
jgi:hypothetical protein